jgi:hypothetical protein
MPTYRVGDLGYNNEIFMGSTGCTVIVCGALLIIMDGRVPLCSSTIIVITAVSFQASSSSLVSCDPLIKQ